MSDAPKKRLTQKEKITQALETIDQFEYSFEGFVKRYPDEAKYKKAVALLRSIVEKKK